MNLTVLSTLVSSPLYASVGAAVVMYVWLWVQQSRDKQCVFTSSMLTRNSIFVGFLVGAAVFLAGRRDDLSEKFMVGSLE